MFQIADHLWELYYDEEYQKLSHACASSLKSENNDTIQTVLRGVWKYAQACDTWEKSYNYIVIQEKFEQSIRELTKLLVELEGTEAAFCSGLITMSKINMTGVKIENAMISNDPKKMSELAAEGQHLAVKHLEQVASIEDDDIEAINELISSYEQYIRAFGIYAEVFVEYRNHGNFEPLYQHAVQSLGNTIQEMIEDNDRITSSEVSGLLANLKASHNYWISDQKQINLNSTKHLLSHSFYVSSDFADHLLHRISDVELDVVSIELFNGKFSVESAGIDGMDDFLQTSIGEEYGDMLHIILSPGTFLLKEWEVGFEIHLYIRRFGVGTIVFSFDMENISPSDFRMIQTLIGPQVGLMNIEWNQTEYSKFGDIAEELYKYLVSYHGKWIEEDDLLDVLQMTSAPYDPDRTWFARGIILEASLIDRTGETFKVESYQELASSFEYKALTLPLVEGRPSLDDWIQIEQKEIDNLASIRLQENDLIVFDTHTITIYLPNKPDFMLQGILSSTGLVNDISTLINGFDVMAERVRSNLIEQITHAKLMLDQVEIDQIKADLKVLRRNVIEVTEFELRALQSIQLLKSQSTIKYQDHARFLLELIHQSSISSTIESLEQKIGIIKQSQEGILRTADDLVAKYQEEVSASQQRLVRVITLIGAGVAQITVIDDILAVFLAQGWIGPNSVVTAKLVVIIIAFIFSGVAITWLAVGYLRSKKKLFE